jgi:hypothetical protein
MATGCGGVVVGTVVVDVDVLEAVSVVVPFVVLVMEKYLFGYIVVVLPSVWLTRLPA